MVSTIIVLASTMFVLETQCQGLSTLIKLNDVEIFRDLNCPGKTAQSKVNGYVIQGKNSITVELGRSSIVPELSDGGNSPSFKMQFSTGEHGKVPDASGIITEYTWDQKLLPLPPVGTAIAWKHQFNVDKAYGRWAWQDAEVVSLNDADKDAIELLVKKVHTALGAGDINALMSMLDLKSEEISRALDIAKSDMMSGQKGFFSSYILNEDWKLKPFDQNSLNYRLQAEGKIVVITDAIGNPPLQGVAGERKFFMDLSVSKINGEWRIIR